MAVVPPLLHAYVYGVVPPETVTVAVPLESLHVSFVDDVVEVNVSHPALQYVIPCELVIEQSLVDVNSIVKSKYPCEFGKVPKETLFISPVPLANVAPALSKIIQGSPFVFVTVATTA